MVAVSSEEKLMHKPLTFRSKPATTVCTEEVLWVPGLVQRCQDVLVNQPDIEKLHHAFTSPKD